MHRENRTVVQRYYDSSDIEFHWVVPLSLARICTSTRDRSHARSFIHASSHEKRVRAKQRKEISAYSPMFTKRRSVLDCDSRRRFNDDDAAVATSSFRRQQKRIENNKNRTRTRKAGVGGGGAKGVEEERKGERRGRIFEVREERVTFWPYFEEARERARAVWPRRIRESTKLSECRRGGREKGAESTRENEVCIGIRRWEEEAGRGERRGRKGELARCVCVFADELCDSYMCRIRTRVVGNGIKSRSSASVRTTTAVAVRTRLLARSLSLSPSLFLSRRVTRS